MLFSVFKGSKMRSCVVPVGTKLLGGAKAGAGGVRGRSDLGRVDIIFD